jgi:hypothetical protein
MKSKLFLCFLFLACFSVQGNHVPEWCGNNHFKISHQDDAVTIRMSKMPWESFSVNLQQMETSEGFLSFELRSATSLTLRVDGLTSDNRQVQLFQEEIAAGDFQQILYNLSSADGRLHNLIFYVNPGREFHGEIEVKGLTIQPYDAQENVVSVFPNPTAGEMLIQLPGKNFSNLTLLDDHGNVVLQKQPEGAQGVVLNLTGRKPGLYVLKAQSNSQLLTTKIILK